MKWSEDAQAAVGKVPFFVRKRVRARVEKEARESGKTRVALSDVKATQARFLNRMSSEVRGYRVETCFAGSGCPNRAVDSGALTAGIEKILADAELLSFLKSRVKGDLKFHHEFRVGIADCPNACSQPQIKDVGILGAASPALTDISCTACGACSDACKEKAIVVAGSGEARTIDFRRCVHCGSCIGTCPTGTLTVGRKGYRVMLGGRLGRHPRLARELPGIFDAQTVLAILDDCLAFYKSRSTHGQRFAHLLTDSDIDHFADKWSP
jgi:anaerobic sulfite reductase subunit C